MRRWIGAAALPGALGLAAGLTAAGPGAGSVTRPVAAGGGQAPAARVVRIDTLNVRDTLYHLADGGGNALALIDEINGGVVLIGTKRPGWGQAVRDAIAQVTDLPVTTLIAPHADPEHVGAHGEFPDAVEIIAHVNTAAHLRRMAPFTAPDAPGLPTVTFTDRLSRLDGLDRFELRHVGPARTDGDLIVIFPEKGTAYLGDLFPAKAAPVIDRARGGSGVAFPDTVAAAAAALDGVTRVITGHAPPPPTYAGRGRRDQGARRAWTGWMTPDDVAEYADFTRAFRDAVTAARAAGRSAAEAADALRLPARFADYDLTGAPAAAEAIYDELAAR